MNKGFTLVELLAVIIILSLLIALTSTSVTKVVKSSKEDLSSSQIKLIESATKNWGAENMSKLPKDGECKYLTLTNLKEYGYISNDVIDPNTNKKIDENLKIKISSKIKNNKNIITYEVDSKEINNCPHASPCILLKGEEDTIGSKYECEVKPGTKYNFYVLSHEDNGSTNLIMDRNICEDGTPTDANKKDKCLVAYISSVDGSTVDIAGKGPESATIYLNNATSTWKNISNLDIEYDDEGGHFINFKLNGKARLPRLDEVYGDGKCSSSSGSCPLWLLNYLASSTYVTGDGLQNISEIYGYWTLSSSAENSIFAWWVDNDGFAWYDIAIDVSIGARPVINVKL